MESLFNEYITVSKNILSAVKNEISADEFFEKREGIINDIIQDASDKYYKKKIYEESGAKELDKQIVDFIKSEMIKTKEDMKRANANKRLYSSYVSDNMSGSFFRRTI